MKRFIYYGYNFKRKIPDLKSLVECVQNDKPPLTYLMSSEVEEWVKQGAEVDVNPLFAGCQFQFADGTAIEYDKKSAKIKRYSADNRPAWFVAKNEYWSIWLQNFQYKSDEVAHLVKEIKDMDLAQRRELADLLFDLDLKKLSSSTTANSHKEHSKPLGNTQGRTTAPRVMDLGSIEFFKQFVDRLQNAIDAHQIPTLQILTAEDDMKAVSAEVKGATRTYYQAICGENVPNVNRASSLNPDIYCDRLKPMIAAVHEIGVENYYAEMVKAIAAANGAFIRDFSFAYPV
ncbi:hypothetical protein [Pantoea sp. USHLN256]|uniref:hypothetical protein n=1 Tax=Pantoea sp. USHLN256 TaxID=3081293 RepID=UPI00301AC3A3